MSAQSIDRLIPVDGSCEVYLVCRGGTGPTVVFEAALGEDHANWLPIAERLAEGGARACVYDRVGTGRASTPSPAVAAADHVRQLHEMLELAEVPRPVILVGHSYGGLVALMATVTHPEDVAGLVLVDSSHPHQVQRFTAALGHPLEDYMSEEDAKQIAAVVDWPASLIQAAALYRQLPAVPLTVITATQPDHWDDDPPDYPYEAVQSVWMELQRELVGLRPNARHVLAATGHYVHQGDADLVVSEISRMREELSSSR